MSLSLSNLQVSRSSSIILCSTFIVARYQESFGGKRKLTRSDYLRVWIYRTFSKVESKVNVLSLRESQENLLTQRNHDQNRSCGMKSLTDHLTNRETSKITFFSIQILYCNSRVRVKPPNSSRMWS